MENAHVFRSLNRRIADQARERLELVCECEAEACIERLVITHVEFSEVERHDGWFVVRPGHESAPVVVAEDSFVVVATSAASERGLRAPAGVP